MALNWLYNRNNYNYFCVTITQRGYFKVKKGKVKRNKKFLSFFHMASNR